jgi:hypothetical protein
MSSCDNVVELVWPAAAIVHMQLYCRTLSIEQIGYEYTLQVPLLVFYPLIRVKFRRMGMLHFPFLPPLVLSSFMTLHGQQGMSNSVAKDSFPLC